MTTQKANRWFSVGVVGVCLLTGCAHWKYPVKIVKQPEGQYVGLGKTAMFKVEAKAFPGYGELNYQWFQNCTPLAVNTNVLVILKVRTNDVGYYSCLVSTEIGSLFTQPVMLMAVSGTNKGGPITIWSVPPPTQSPHSGTVCPEPYVGYHSFTKPTAPFGWAPNTETPHTATDTTRTNTKIKFFGSTFGNNGCSPNNSITVTPLNSTTYRFTVYFPNNMPNTAYPLVLNGFDP